MMERNIKTTPSKSHDLLCEDGNKRSFMRIQISPSVAESITWDISEYVLTPDPPITLQANPFFEEFPSYTPFVLRTSKNGPDLCREIWLSVPIEDSILSEEMFSEFDQVSPSVLYNPKSNFRMVSRATPTMDEPERLIFKGKEFTNAVHQYEVGFYDVPAECLREHLAYEGYRKDLVSEEI